MRARKLLATCFMVAVSGLGAGAVAAHADPSPKADCVAQSIAFGGAPGAAPGQNGPASGASVSTLARQAHWACGPSGTS